MSAGQLVKSSKQVKSGDTLDIQLAEGGLSATVTKIKTKEESTWTLKKN
jgi:ribosomal 50S subunit-recycling heat shock protein